MYKCTDCGQEFDTKPEYCDCGNNIFEEIIAEKKVKRAVKFKQTKSNIKFDILSWIIFGLCIILSIFVWIFIGNGEDAAEHSEKPKEHVEIPSINELWKENNIKSTEKQTQNFVPKITVEPKKVVKPIQSTKPAKTTPASSIKRETKPVQNTMTEEQKKKLVERLTTPSNDVKKPVPVVDEAALRRELVSYKIALRNKIASNIDFARVIGDGNCAVTFKVDSSGNLIDRKFSIQSNNNSLNDVVYSAMIQNPGFQRPPKGYKGETFTLSVKMYGGNFEVSLN